MFIRILILFLALLSISSNSYAVVDSFKFPTGGGGTTKWFGYPNSSGTPDAPTGSWNVYGSAGDRVYSTPWTATENGTVQCVNIYQNKSFAVPTDAYAVFYNGTTLIGKVDVSGETGTNVWTGCNTVVVEGGQSLDYSTNDVMRCGVSFNEGGVSMLSVDSTGSTVIDFDSTATTGVPPATASWTTSGTPGIGVVCQVVTR